MKSKSKLSPAMTLKQFDNGYWYALELKEFAERLGVPGAAKLRKDELEKTIRTFLKTGKIESPTRRKLTTEGIRDVERGLSLNLPVVAYTNDKETKSFLEREAQRIAPGHKRRSGARYRLNRWRDEQLTKGVKLTYGALVREYVRLNQPDEPYQRIPTACYIYFLSDFLAAEKNATRVEAIKAWKKLKTLDAPKTYSSWVQYAGKKRANRTS